MPDKQDRLATIDKDYDLLVIGGGINGAGVARDAAQRGYRVLLLEQNDFGSGASSKSSKLIHGGLRYLEHGQLRLVWEACHERQTLLRLAPHLVRPLSFVFPIYEDSRIDQLRLRVGMWLYDLMAAFRNVQHHRMLDIRGRDSRLRGLQSENLRAAALYYDAIMDDARLVLANVISAQESSAHAFNGVAVRRLHVDAGVVCGVEAQDTLTEQLFTVRARSTVLCTGAWTNRVLEQLPGGMQPVAPTRGTHLLIPRITNQAFTLAAARDGRVFFVLPWLGLNLVGTTDVESHESVDLAVPTEEEVHYLLEETNRFFPEARLARTDVISAFAGLRPLQSSEGAESSRSREHSILEPVPGMLVVIGGKYTTYRTVAEEVVNRITPVLGRRKACVSAQRPLAGGDLAWSATEHWNEHGGFLDAVQGGVRRSGLPEASVRRLFAKHGTRATGIIELVAANRELGAPLCEHHAYCRGEVVFAVREEMALHLDDWFLRRSRMGFHSCHGIDAIETVADVFAQELGWNDGQRADEVTRGRQQLDAIALTRSPASSHSS